MSIPPAIESLVPTIVALISSFIFLLIPKAGYSSSSSTLPKTLSCKARGSIAFPLYLIKPAPHL